MWKLFSTGLGLSVDSFFNFSCALIVDHRINTEETIYIYIYMYIYIYIYMCVCVCALI